jgi:hypothetical protein
MICSANLWNLNTTYLIFVAPQKWQNLIDFEILKSYIICYYRCQNLLFVHNHEYNYIRYFKLKVSTFVDHGIVYMYI